MKEFFEKRRITGAINIALAGLKNWTADKSDV
jgi:hypothetical protein